MNKENILKSLLILASTFIIFGVILGLGSLITPWGFLSFIVAIGFSTLAGTLIWINVNIK